MKNWRSIAHEYKYQYLDDEDKKNVRENTKVLKCCHINSREEKTREYSERIESNSYCI